jgi:hypothetical protein
MKSKAQSFKSICLFAVLAFVVAGCAATGPSYTSVKSAIPQLQSDNSRIYFLREGGFVNSGLTARVHLNGIKIVDLNMDGFAYVDRPAGNMLIMIDASLNFGEARKMFTVESGKTYYFLVANDSSNVLAGIIGGSLGAVSEGGGRFVFYRIPESMALEQLKTKKKSGD